MKNERARYYGHRFPPEIISYAVWVYHRFCLSFRDVEDLLAERGIVVSYETIRLWGQKFGPDYARKLKRRQGRLGDIWHMDEVFIRINGQQQYLWRAVDQDGDVIDILVQPRRYSAAMRTSVCTEHYSNNRAEASHQATRPRKRQMRRFKSGGADRDSGLRRLQTTGITDQNDSVAPQIANVSGGVSAIQYKLVPMATTPRSSIALFAALLSAAALAQPLPRAGRPEEVGVSSERLERVRQQMRADVENNRIPGAVLLIARKARIASLDAIGFQARRTQTPMRPDSIFRIASMSKPITSVAAMILAEEGKLDIGAPVTQYLPEFKDVKVGVEMVTPKRPMTVQDLLRHTSGLTYGIFGNSSVDELYKKSNLFASKSLSEMVANIARLPLLHHPGEVWEYSVSTDVLGRIVEVASGMNLDQFVAGRITRPLKMVDTGFYLNASQATRLAHPDAAMMIPPGDPTAMPAIFSGGGGMLSTAGDYARFCQMMLNGGELEGVRILSPHTVALMTSDQLPRSTDRHSPVAIVLNAFGPTPEMGTSFGLGFGVRTDAGRNPSPGSAGDFSWAGITGTYFWVDPLEKLVTVLMIQVPPATNVPYWRRTRTLVYQALTN